MNLALLFLFFLFVLRPLPEVIFQRCARGNISQENLRHSSLAGAAHAEAACTHRQTQLNSCGYTRHTDLQLAPTDAHTRSSIPMLLSSPISLDSTH